MIHLCPDELAALTLLGSLGACWRYCWRRVVEWRGKR